MTALDRYAKLEAVARYLDGRSPTPREVVLSFGERSLIIMGLDDRPIAHWPLASLRALGVPDEHPLELVPDASSQERLLLEDREMSAAIAEVCPGLHRAPERPRRRRRPVLWAGIAAAALLAAALAALPFLPDRLIDLVPPEREAALGEALVAHLARSAGTSGAPALCTAEEGLATLRALTDRVAGHMPSLRVMVLDLPGAEAFTLPGGRVVVFRGLLQAARTPEEAAGILAHAIGHALARDPLQLVLDRAGIADLPALLLGDITGPEVLEKAAAALEAGYAPAAEAAADETAHALLALAGLPTTPSSQFAARLAKGAAGAAPYAARHPWSERRAHAAAAADTIGAAPFTPALRDRDWIALFNICDRTRPVAGF